MRVLSLGIGGLVLAGVLIAVGAPVVLVVLVGSVLGCAGMTLAMGYGDPNGDRLLETARRAGRPPKG